jgi:hypothetical protein
MASLVDRLRLNRNAVDYSTAAIMEEAAREIERLLDECDALRQANQYLGVYTPSTDWPDDA